MAKTEEIKYTKYEKARIIGSRALQISMGAPFLIDFTEKELEGMNFNTLEIAKAEFEQNALSITIKRESHFKRDRKKDKVKAE